MGVPRGVLYLGTVFISFLAICSGHKLVLTPSIVETKSAGDSFSVSCKVDHGSGGVMHRLKDLVKDVTGSGALMYWHKVEGNTEVELPAEGNVRGGQSQNRYVGSRLTFTNVSTEDSGEYRCKMDQDSISIQIRIQAPLEFVDPAVEQKATIGEDATLSCRTNFADAITIWTKNGRPLAMCDRARYSIAANGNDLKITSFSSPEDDGEYGCQVVQESTGMRIKRMVTVVGKNDTSLLLTPPQMDMKTAGDRFRVTCEAKDTTTVDGGVPQNLKWYKVDGTCEREVVFLGNVWSSSSKDRAALIFLNASVADAGTYRCTDGYKSASIQIPIEAAFEFVDTPEEQNPTITSVKCRASFPDAIITWSKDGQPLGTGEVGGRYSLMPNGSDLRIDLYVHPADDGVYVCEAAHPSTGAVISRSIKVGVHFAEPPKKPSSVTVEVEADTEAPAEAATEAAP